MTTHEDIKRMISESNVSFIRLQFVDIFGHMKNVAITTAELDRVLDQGMVFDGSSIEGFVRIEESDMYLRPDPDTFCILPWYKDHVIARMICDVYRPDGTPFSGDPRRVLRSAIEEAASMGYEFHVGPECEFFLFHKDDQGRPTTLTHDQAGYFDLAPTDNGELARIEMVKTLIDMGFKIEAAHHESGPGQHEIDFKYSDALSAADNIVTFKYVVKVIAQKFGLHATFMPKPLGAECGNGMHCNMSLFTGHENAFYDPSHESGLSQEAFWFMGGLMKHAKGMCAITNPLVNSYKRLVPGYEAPVYIAWSMANRSPLVRIPVARGTGTRLELRHPDPTCNPYLALAVMLKSGLDGIRNKITPPPAVDKNIYNMTESDLKKAGIEKLPPNLSVAIAALEKDELIKQALGAHILENFLKAKKFEWADYSGAVHPWEIERYLKLY